MRKSIALTLGEASSKMSGHVALLNYRYLNLCVKAEAASLLIVTVEYDGHNLDIEQVADVASPREDQLQVYPKSPDLLVPISKAIATVHPEFKQEVIKEENNNGSSSSDNEEEEDKSILLTMPEVDKNRRDALMEGVKLLYDETTAELTAIYETYTQKAIIQLMDGKAEEIDECKKALDDLKKEHFDLADNYRKNKEKEIEDAYKHYMEQKEEKNKNKQEHEAATNKKAGHSLKMGEVAADLLIPEPAIPIIGKKKPEMPKAPKMPEMPKAPKMPEMPKAPKVEAPKMEMPKMEMPKPDVPKPDVPKPDISKMEMPKAAKMPKK